MRKDKKLAAAVLAVATLVGTSAFAESRPANGTSSRSGVVQRNRASTSTTARRGNDSSNRSRGDNRQGSGRNENWRRNDRSNDRSNDRNVDRNRSNDRNWDRNRGGYDNNRSYSRDRNRGDHSYNNRQRYQARGRVSQVHRYGSGYRVWIVGAPYPFFIPSAYYHRDRFRVGLSIHLGGYYNPLGYYDYDDAYYYGRSSSSAGELRGVVESVDYRRDTFVVRNDATGSFVTVVLRDRHESVRPGDYVELSGDWTRSGVFQAFDVDRLNDDYYRR